MLKQTGPLAGFVCFLVWAWCQTTPPSPAQQDLARRAEQYFDQGDYGKVADLSENLLQTLDPVAQRPLWYDAVWRYTISAVQLGQAGRAGRFLLPALQQHPVDDSVTAKVHGLLGYAYLNSRNFERGAWHFEQNLDGLLRHRCRSGVGFAYMNLGYSLKEQGDYRAAKQYYLRALPVLRQEGDRGNLAEALTNLGDIHRYIGAFGDARQYYQDAYQLHQKPADLSALLGWVEADQGHYAEALAHFQRACPNGACADLARIMGRCSEALGDTSAANRQYAFAFKAAENGRDSAIVFYYLGQSLLHRKRPAEAAKTFQRGLCRLFPLLSSSLKENPYQDFGSDFWPINLLHGKAKALRQWYAQSGDREHLHRAAGAAQAAIQALEALRTGMRNEVSGQDALDYAYGTYETAILTALDRRQSNDRDNSLLGEAYQTAEYAKSKVLKSNLLEKDLRKTLVLPDSLVWREQAAQAAAAYWEEQGQHDSLLAAVRHLERVQKQLDRAVPLLGKWRKQSRPQSLDALRKALPSDALLLQYFWGDSAVVIFAIHTEGLKVHTLPRTADLERDLAQLRAALTQWQLAHDAYARIARPVFDRLCAPLLDAYPDTKHLIVVPDGPLWAIPFEALVDGQGHFLVERCALSYHWSGALWLDAHRQEPPPNLVYGGFAPRYDAPANPAGTQGASLADLPEARAAVVEAAQAWGGTAWEGDSIGEGLFRREAGRYGVLHLAMHGLLEERDQTRTGLAFPGPGGGMDVLNILEISQLDLKAQLAVLSACNTGSGPVFRGEGAMSLSRAFALAGCPALTANLWEVPSRETNVLIAQFLQKIHDGKAKDEALSQAKRDFLAQAEPERRHPYFWAGPVLLGNEQPLRQKFGIWWVVLVGALVGLGLGWAVKRF